MIVPSGVRHACKRLAGTPLLSIGAIVILALGIGATVVMLDVLDRLLLRPPQGISHPDRVARVYMQPERGTPITFTGYGTVEALQALGDTLEASAAYFHESLSLGRGAEARKVDTVAHSQDYFAVLGMSPLLGAWPAPRDETGAVISHRLWQQEFGGSPEVLGRSLRFGLDTYTIVAVAPRGFVGVDTAPADVWLPLVPRARSVYGQDWQRSAFFLQAVVRLRQGVSHELASARATAAYRATHAQPWEPRSAVVLGDLRPARAPGADLGTRVEVLAAGMSLLLFLLTCGNVANFLLVRGLRRDREFVVKTALGAGRGRLFREVLGEAGVLAAAAGVLALVVAVTAGSLLRREFLFPRAALGSALDARVLLVTIALSVTAAFVLGLMPALRLTGRRALAPGHAAPSPPSRLLDLFSGLQVALSLPMIVAAALLVISFSNARHQDLGMQTDGVLVVTTNLFEVGRPWDTHAVHREMQARIAALPQVEATALVQDLPMRTSTQFIIEVPGKDVVQLMGGQMPAYNYVDPSFFQVMRMRLVEGRWFTDAENREGAAPVAVVTESLARAIWPGESAIGKCFHGQPCTEVVGVAADARLFPSIRPTNQWAAAVYVPINRGASGASRRSLLVRTEGDPSALLPTLRREAQGAAADLPYVEAFAFDDVFVTMLRPWRLGSVVFVLFGLLSTTIAAAGLAVVGGYAVTRRTREIGIRSALGAQPPQLVRLVLRRSTAVLVLAVAAGAGLAWYTGRLLTAQLFEVTATDPRVFLAAALLLAGVGVLAAWVPARRAAAVDPVAALRTE